MILVAGGGIAGLALGLTLHQIGLPFRVHEAVAEPAPLGVGINLQPNAVRELLDLGLGPMLEAVGVATREYGFFTRHGQEIWVEPRGRAAGYAWPQYSVHRGRLQMAMLAALRERAGPDCVATGARATGFAQDADGVTLHLEGGAARGALLIAADGIHSAIRAQLRPDEGPPVWGGAVLWRGVTRAAPFRTGASMILAGHDAQRVVAYPITPADPGTGLAEINWIAELTRDPSEGWRREDWTRTADLSEVRPAFADWRFGWLDVPALIDGAARVWEYPMVDRDPLPRWTEGAVTLMGDAAHPTYPVGSNGASQAILDARVLGAALLDHGVGAAALEAYEARVRPVTERVTLANRGQGPDAVMQRVEDLTGGRPFDAIEDVLPRAELAAHAARYKALAGLSIQELNARPPTIDPARLDVAGTRTA